MRLIPAYHVDSTTGSRNLWPLAFAMLPHQVRIICWSQLRSAAVQRASPALTVVGFVRKDEAWLVGKDEAWFVYVWEEPPDISYTYEVTEVTGDAHIGLESAPWWTRYQTDARLFSLQLTIKGIVWFLGDTGDFFNIDTSSLHEKPHSHIAFFFTDFSLLSIISPLFHCREASLSILAATERSSSGGQARRR